MEHEFEDFDLVPCEYRVLVQGIDTDGNDISGIQVLWTGADPEEAIQKAKDKASEFWFLLNSSGSKWEDKILSAVTVTVETVVQVEGEEHYAGTLFKDTVFAKTS